MFNIAGNKYKYRLVVWIKYLCRVLYIRFIRTGHRLQWNTAISATERQVKGHGAIHEWREAVVLVERPGAGILCIDE